MALDVNLHCKITGLYTSSPDLGSLNFSPTNRAPTNLANGTGSSQANRMYSDQRTLGASASETLDLDALTDVFGASLAFVKIKSIRISAASGNTNNVVVGGGDWTAPFSDATDKLVIPPGGSIMLNAPVSGWAVTATTADGLLVANSGAGTSVVYDIEIVGTDA
jgi:hypothetical protein